MNATSIQNKEKSDSFSTTEEPLYSRHLGENLVRGVALSSGAS